MLANGEDDEKGGPDPLVSLGSPKSELGHGPSFQC